MTLILCTGLFLLSACGRERVVPSVAGGFYLDTYVSVSLSDQDAADQTLTVCGMYEQMFSKTITDSDVWRINHSAGYPVTVSTETIELLQKTKEYYVLTDGHIDPTIGTVSALWDFHKDIRDTDTPSVPSAEALEEALSHVSMENVLIQGNTVTLTDPATQLDLGFIAKGAIADRMRDVVLDISEYSEDYEPIDVPQPAGFGNSPAPISGILNLGGNVVLIGDKPGAQDGLYTVGIEKPFGGGEPLLTINVKDCSVVTSGVDQRYFYEGGVLYHHILDAATGMPVNNGLYSVTIVCENATDADALSTTCFVLGKEKGLALIEAIDDAEALFIDENLQVFTSSGFPEYTLLND